MKNSEAIANRGVNFFSFLPVTATVNTTRICKLRKDILTGIGYTGSSMVLAKRLHLFIFKLPKTEQ
jgi:hypothetical protein